MNLNEINYSDKVFEATNKINQNIEILHQYFPKIKVPLIENFSKLSDEDLLSSERPETKKSGIEFLKVFCYINTLIFELNRHYNANIYPIKPHEVFTIEGDEATVESDKLAEQLNNFFFIRVIKLLEDKNNGNTMESKDE